MLPANAAELRIVQNQVAEFSALLNEVHFRKAFDLVVKRMKPDKLGKNHSRVVEAQSLVKVAGQKILLHHVLVLLRAFLRISPAASLARSGCGASTPTPITLPLFAGVALRIILMGAMR